MRRRAFIGTLLLTCASLPQKLFAGVTSAGSNFKRIYSSITLKNEFFKFHGGAIEAQRYHAGMF